MKRKTETGRNWMFHVPIGDYMTDCAITISNGPAFTRTFIRDPYRKHLVNAVSNCFDGVSVHSTSYAHDLLSRRTNIVMTAPTGTNILSCAYNARSEVTGVTIDTNAYTYIKVNYLVEETLGTFRE